MSDESAMSLERALDILSTVHTRDNAASGFVVMVGAMPDMGNCVSEHDYVKAWEAVRKHLHLQTEPAD